MEDSPRVKSYHRAGRILSVTGFILDLAVLIALLATGWSITFRNWAEGTSAHPAVALLVYLALFGAVTKSVGLPLDYLGGYWLEHRYGLSNLTLKGWLWDQLKALALGGTLAILGLELLYWTLRRWPIHWWVVTATVFVAFIILLSHLAPIIIFPIFFKFHPLDKPELAERLVELCRRARTRVRGVFEWKLSEKSKKANAALVGLGNTRRIILADTLLEKFTDDEVEAVLAHELGHHVHRHMFQGMLIQAAAIFLGFYLADRALLRLSPVFGLRGPSDFANLPLLALVFSGLSLLILPAVNAHSRRMERQADAYALGAIAQSSAFVSGMEKLAELNLAEREPHPWIEFIFHSHPSIGKRVAFAKRFSRGQGMAVAGSH
jgi:Zn-dependent protease with chaperone function